MSHPLYLYVCVRGCCIYTYILYLYIFVHISRYLYIDLHVCARVCDENEMTRVVVSNDVYHQYEEGYNETLLKGLSFYGKRGEKDGMSYMGERSEHGGLINEGRAFWNYGSGRENSVEEINDQDSFNEAEIYLNCEGNILNGCNWSYENQNNHILSNVAGLKSFYKQLELDPA